MVFLSAKNIYTEQSSRKLDWKHLGPFPVLRKINTNAYEIKLPLLMKIYPVFHSSLLQPAATDPMSGQRPTEPPPIVINGEQEYELRSIIDSRYNKRRKRLEYKVQWTGYDQMDWEPAENLEHAKDLLKDFHAAYLSKPGPPEDVAESGSAG